MVENTVAAQTTTPSFLFHGFSVKGVVFQTLERTKPEPGEKRPTKPEHEASFGGSIQFSPDGKRGIVTLTVGIRPDPKWQPYQIDVSLSGRFEDPSGNQDHFFLFCKMGAPSILFPYIREIIHSVTRDGAFGSVRLDPLNVQALFSDWTVDQPKETESTESSEPSPPSGLSPDA